MNQTIGIGNTAIDSEGIGIDDDLYPTIERVNAQVEDLQAGLGGNGDAHGIGDIQVFGANKVFLI